MNKCIFQSMFKYDPCRSCDGYNLSCPNRLEEFRFSKPITPKEDINVIRAVRPLPSAETSSGELHIDSIMASYGRFNFWQHKHTIQEPILPRPNFLERFRKYQR